MSSSAARALARRYVFPLVETGWAAGWWAVGRLLRPERRARLWHPRPDERVVVVAPHPDDETIGAGGVLALHLRAGNPVTIAVLTDGGASRAGNLARADMVRRRAAEVAAATRLLGGPELRRVGLPEGEWDEGSASDLLAPLLRDADIVYAPSSVDYHPEHIRVARVVAGLLRPGQIIRVYELGVPLTPVLANLVADIADVAQAKEQALAAFATQAQALAPLRRCARYRGQLYARREVELFWELPAEEYARVIAASPWPGDPGPFRGIRARPFGDPLAALVGLRARRRLRKIARHHGTPAGQPSIGAMRGAAGRE